MKAFWKKWSFLILFIGKCLTCAAVTWAVVTFIMTPYRVTGNAMFPAVKDGDLALLYQLEQPYNNDIVVYELNGQAHIGRVVAVAGQEVNVSSEGGYTVNGYAPMEDIAYATYAADIGVEYPLIVGENEVFVLHDYRDDMSDSRTYGVVSFEQITGKILFLFRRRGF